MPCYGQERYINDALNSVFSQSYRNWELVVVDDGSPGRTCAHRTRELLEIHVNRYGAQTIIVSTGRNVGLSAARNNAISQISKGDIILPCDADDYLAPDFLHQIVLSAQENKAAKLFYADQIFFSHESEAQKHTGRHWHLVPCLNLAYASKRGPLPVMTAFTREAFNAIGGYAANMIFGNEDYDFWLRMLQARTPTVKVRGISGWYRVKMESMRSDNNYKMLALPMLFSRNPWLYATGGNVIHIVQSMAALFCHLHDPEHAYRLQRAVYQQPRVCSSWLWLALYKLGNGCIGEAHHLVSSGLFYCQDKSSYAAGLRRTDPHAHVASASQLRILKDVLDRPNATRLVSSLAGARSTCQTDQKYCATCETAFLSSIDVKHELCTDMSAIYNDGPLSHKPLKPKSMSDPSQWDIAIDVRLASDVRKAIQAPPSVMSSTPNIVHFVYGLSDENNLRFGLVEYLAMRSALEVHQSKIYLHCIHTPPSDGFWWSHAKQFVKIVRHNARKEFAGRCMIHHAHRADVMRLEVLEQYGGIYLDMDVISIRQFSDEIRNKNEFVLAWQDSYTVGTVREGKRHYGLCNAGMLARPHSRFVKMWMGSYRYFRSHGRDPLWDEHSVILPANLTERYPELVKKGLLKTLPAYTMWEPLWSNVEEMLFASRNESHLQNSDAGRIPSAPGAYIIHLWRANDNSKYGKRLNNLENEVQWFKTTEFGRFAQKYISLNWRLFGRMYTPKRLH